MLPLSKLSIPLNNHSIIAIKLSCCLVVAAFFALFYADIYWLIKGVVVIFIVAGLIRTIRHRAWSHPWAYLHFEDEQWHLQCQQSMRYTLDCFKEVFNSPLMSLFYYQNADLKGHLILFKDQISSHEYHTIILLTRL